MKKLIITIALSLLPTFCVAATLDQVLAGHNNHNQEVEIAFEDLPKLHPTLARCLAVTIEVNGKFFILIDKSNKNAPKEALYALVAHEATHAEDSEDSINEEVVAFTQNCKYWEIYVVGNPKLLKDKSRLVKNLNYALALYLKGNRTDKYLRPFVEDLYRGYPQTSPGFE